MTPIDSYKRVDYSVIIPAYNEAQYLPATLASLKQSMGRVGKWIGEVVVTDNNSTDRTAAIAEAAGARVVFEKHRQISRARNTGAKHATGNYLIFLDGGTTLSPGLLKQTLSGLESGTLCGGGTVVEFDGHLPFVATCAHRLWLLLSRTFKWACGAYVFCTREAFIETGGFDERYYASEEIHYSITLRRWGRKSGKRFVILEQPIISSRRKLEWYSSREIILMCLGLLFYLKPFQTQGACDKMWYRRPEGRG